MWVVDTGAGRGITSDRSWFTGSLKPDLSHVFTYGYLSALNLTEISYNRKCDSNSLSAYYLAKQGNRHIQSKSGDFLFFIGDNFTLLLGHVGKERLIRTLNNEKITGLPKIPYSELKKVHFFCKTCAQMKDRRMSYKNMVGAKATEPLHTLHMDSTGKLRVNGLYGCR
ncbi:hypothetical protein PHYSODRAFT_470891 [Phytophthora sojae]|uniref:Uncharacterized protein n=1 Tax=Phytophthora sojae (strain P6497) TaxID=1094619 RepID=G4YR06_PHYSP|nr:hypothetical protein PHYSODRAFT_470891 [Phytophthora sojae]EGZ30634.1 hypothetical protein PHYSODRAFT_470891 [Phytophthora sojae]|eukprot:XP_009517909.1 hypothetical protein PHYSODRAFT_470891 [Phytophthora sojae]